jgi:signal transduction histidine kinase
VWLFEDTQTHPLVDEVTRENWKAIEILSFVGPSLYVNQRWLGGITFHSKRPRSYTGRQVRLFAGIGDLVLAAVERIRLQRETELATQTFAVLEERNRLARELHDSVSQALYGIALTVKTARVLIDRAPEKAAEPLDYVLSLSQAALSEMRTLIFELRPETLEKEGLIEALNRQAEMLHLRYGVTVDAALCDEPPVSLDIKENIYWIAREALHNVIKHARATRVHVTLRCDDTEISLRVVDNGIGFAPENPRQGHLGLRSMSERAARINGTLHITSQPSSGTQVLLTAPAR